jgi:hypothetical protein
MGGPDPRGPRPGRGEVDRLLEPCPDAGRATWPKLIHSCEIGPFACHASVSAAPLSADHAGLGGGLAGQASGGPSSGVLLGAQRTRGPDYTRAKCRQAPGGGRAEVASRTLAGTPRADFTGEHRTLWCAETPARKKGNRFLRVLFGNHFASGSPRPEDRVGFHRQRNEWSLPSAIIVLTGPRQAPSVTGVL